MTIQELRELKELAWKEVYNDPMFAGDKHIKFINNSYLYVKYLLRIAEMAVEVCDADLIGNLDKTHLKRLNEAIRDFEEMTV